MVQFNEQVFRKNRLVAWASRKLKQHGVIGLKEAPFFCGLLEKLSTLLQEQYSFEKVFPYFTHNLYIAGKLKIEAWLSLCILASPTNNLVVDYFKHFPCFYRVRVWEKDNPLRTQAAKKLFPQLL